MALNDVVDVCARLAPAGWGRLLRRHGLNLEAEDLTAELSRPLPDIDRSVPGFEDLAEEAGRGIEPGIPARSLLYHALASPNVIEDGDGRPLDDFPTLSELEAVENAVFGLAPPTLPDLRRRAGGAFLAIAVFAVEYRPAAETVHRRHADLCFSRTGVARVGTADAHYDACRRGFVPDVEDDAHAFRVLPARYAPYVAVQLRGDDGRFGPMNADLRRSHPEFFGPDSLGDNVRAFWVPLHKLFDGPECIRGLDLSVQLEVGHRNEKIRRIHVELGRRGVDTGWAAPDVDNPPFIFADGIAEWSGRPEHGNGVLVPVPHAHLVEPAEYQGAPLTFLVPPNPGNDFAPSLFIDPEEGFRRAPEYVHVRTVVADDGSQRDLNDEPDVAGQVRHGDYRALHYVDHTGDGWVVARIPQLAVDLPRSVPAYSVVTAPDFYPHSDQRELMEWWVQRAPTALRDDVWQVPPLTLSDERLPPNLQLAGVDFRAEDETVTAVVSLPLDGPVQARPLVGGATRRHAHLPDAAAGVFAPGWDTSLDRSAATAHLAAYGLGSPFPEDAKLCAALSAFWPAVAPDASRSFSRTFPTVSPMTDAEIGVDGDEGAPAWDGVPGPRRVIDNGAEVVEYASFDHVDYTEQGLRGRFSLALTGRVDTIEYTARVLAMTRVYQALGLTTARRRWPVLSFRPADPADDVLLRAQADTGTTLQGQVHRIELFERGRERPHATDHRRVHVEQLGRLTTYVGALPVVLVQRNGGAWQAQTTP
jgi:hypothetical protein